MSSYILKCCSGLILLMMFRFRGGAVLSVCCVSRVHMGSVGEKRKEYRHLFLWLV